MQVRIPISPGELVDRITILRIKAERIASAQKVENVRHELGLLERDFAAAVPTSERLEELTAALRGVNERLWDIEDAIREHEQREDFGPQFVELARAVYKTNDRRAELKREVNTLLGSVLVEEKSYV